jgi:hypothetical protein
VRIISFDPGGTTGVAIYDDEDLGPECIESHYWERKSLGPDPHHQELWGMLVSDTDVTDLVYETFNYQRRELTRGVSLRLDSVEYIGIIKLAIERSSLWGRPGLNVSAQSPPTRMFWTDDFLRALGLWVSSPHERDATRHLLAYVTNVLKDNRFVYPLRHLT